MRKQLRIKTLVTSFLGASLFLSGITGCAAAETGPAVQSSRAVISTSKTEEENNLPETTIHPVEANTMSSKEEGAPKYVFLFIGDGMSYVQVNAAQVYLGNNTPGEVKGESLNFTRFPVAGNVTTNDATSFCPDSASTATALSCGIKTHSGVIGLEADKLTKPESITEILHNEGIKIGIVSTVTINHATPAAFYSHIVSRNEYYPIAMQLATSGFEYFGGGSVNKATGNDGSYTDAYSIIEKKGYMIADTKEEILALSADSGMCYAVSPVLQDSGAMPYSIDAKEGDLAFADYVETGIRVLDNENGFFMACESGKIDWSCHANDAMSTIREVIDFAEGIQVAIDFASEHPDETLILVTGDHETGGMTIGYAATGYNTAFDELVGQMKEENPELTLQDMLPVIKENFGLLAPDDVDASVEENIAFVMTDYEYAKLEAAFAESMAMATEEEREQTQEAALLYGGYDPVSVTVTHILNNKAGIGWTSYSHTGTPVSVYAMGTQAELFGGSYDNTDVFYKLLTVMSLNDEILEAA